MVRTHKKRVKKEQQGGYTKLGLEKRNNEAVQEKSDQKRRQSRSDQKTGE